VQQSVSVHAMYGEQLAHIYSTVTDVGAGVEPLSMQQSMAQQSTSLSRCQSGATPTHTHTYTTNTVDACKPTHTLLSYDVDVYATGPQSHRTSPVSNIDVDDDVNPMSLMEQSEVQLNPPH